MPPGLCKMPADRPLVWIGAAFIFGIIIQKMLMLGIGPYAAAAAVLLAVSAFLIVKERSASIFIIVLVVVSGGGWLAVVQAENVSQLTSLAGKRVELQGWVSTRPESGEGSLLFDFNVETAVVGGSQYRIKNGEKVRARWYFDQQDAEYEVPRYGDEIIVTGELQLPLGKRNPGDFNYRDYVNHRGIHTLIHVYRKDQLQVVTCASRGSVLFSWIASGREAFSSALEVLPRRNAALLEAMVFGDTSGVSREETELFRSIGLGHAMAVSGLHVGYVLWLLFAVSRLVRLGPNGTAALCFIGLFAYCALAGFAVSVVRAAVMGLTAVSAYLFDRERNVYVGLSLAALIILIWNPLFLFEPGFQLSFVSVLSIAYLTPVLDELLYFLPWWRKYIILVLAVQAGIAPLLIYYFNLVSLVSVFANVLLVPVVGMIVISGLLAFVFFSCGIPGAGPLIYAAGALVDMMTSTGRLIGSIPWSSVSMGTPGILGLIGYYTMLAVLVETWRRRERVFSVFDRRTILWVLAVILVVAAAAGTYLGGHNPLEIVFLDVGQGDAVFIQTPRGRSILIDGGGVSDFYRGSFRPGRDVVLPFLRRRGVNHIDMMVSTHPDADHISGLETVLSSLSVGSLVTPPTRYWGDEYQELLTLAAGSGVPHGEASLNSRILIEEGLRMRVLAPQKGSTYSTSNAASLVVMLEHGSNSFLLTGDIEGEGLRELTGEITNLDCTVLKIPHHGSEESYSEDFYGRARPEAVVISVGRDNSFGHPSQKVIEYFTARGIPVFRTDEHGAVIVKSSGRDCRVDTVIPAISEGRMQAEAHW